MFPPPPSLCILTKLSWSRVIPLTCRAGQNYFRSRLLGQTVVLLTHSVDWIKNWRSSDSFYIVTYYIMGHYFLGTQFLSVQTFLLRMPLWKIKKFSFTPSQSIWKIGPKTARAWRVKEKQYSFAVNFGTLSICFMHWPKTLVWTLLELFRS